MHIQEVEPPAGVRAVLAGAQFADAYRATPGKRPSSARAAAEQMFSTSPGWVRGLMGARNRIVRPFGLKAPAAKPVRDANSVGMFPIVSEAPNRLVAGFDDAHLDFRVVVDLSASGEVTATTVVLIHNLLGRIYLTAIMPFHRLIVRTMLSQIG